MWTCSSQCCRFSTPCCPHECLVGNIHSRICATQLISCEYRFLRVHLWDASAFHRPTSLLPARFCHHSESFQVVRHKTPWTGIKTSIPSEAGHAAPSVRIPSFHSMIHIKAFCGLQPKMSSATLQNGNMCQMHSHSELAAWGFIAMRI